MKFFIILALVTYVNCVPSIVNTGQSAVTRSEDGHGNYAFGYNEDHATGGSFRKEKGGPGVQVGSYGLRDADGRMRVVSYVADAHGFRATVSSNEPGVDPKQDPAAMAYNGQGHAAPIPAPISHAPIPGPIAYPAPATHGPAYASPVSTSSYQISTQHIAPPVHAPIAAPAPVLAKSYAASAPIAHAAPAPILAKSYAAPAPILAKSYAPAPIAYSAPAPAQIAHAAPAQIAHAAPAPIAYSAPAPIATAAIQAAAPIAHEAPAPILAKSYAAPGIIAGAAPLIGKADIAGLAATYSIHTLGSPRIGYGKAY